MHHEHVARRGAVNTESRDACIEAKLEQIAQLKQDFFVNPDIMSSASTEALDMVTISLAVTPRKQIKINKAVAPPIST